MPILVGLALVGLALLAASASALAWSGARPRLARRLAGPRELEVGELLTADRLPERPVRVTGRIRCGDAIRAPGDERLVALHSDVEVRVGGRWRIIERARETRSFELWDRGGSLTIDPARAAEPLVVIPKVWRGGVEELGEPLRSTAGRLSAGPAPAEARAVTRTINVTDQLRVVGVARRDAGGRVRLEPPDGGYLITNLTLPDAMRLLGGRHRRLAAFAIVGIGLGALLIVGPVIALVTMAVLA
jgi:hypothetical protein